MNYLIAFAVLAIRTPTALAGSRAFPAALDGALQPLQSAAREHRRSGCLEARPDFGLRAGGSASYPAGQGTDTAFRAGCERHTAEHGSWGSLADYRSPPLPC